VYFSASLIIFAIGHVALWRHLDVPAPQGGRAFKHLAGVANVSSRWLLSVVLAIDALALVPLGVAYALSPPRSPFYVLGLFGMLAIFFAVGPLTFLLSMRYSWRRALADPATRNGFAEGNRSGR
jgi:hypothetical protein